MRKKVVYGLCFALLIAASACAGATSSGVEITDLTPAEVPEDVRKLIEASEAGFSIVEAQRKVRDGRTYYDVEGQRSDGSEIEFDVLVGPSGPQIVEIQRDLDWTDVPAGVRAAAETAAPGLKPVRVIESRQMDGTIIFELFAPGAPSDPAMEVSWTDGVGAVLKERWPH